MIDNCTIYFPNDKIDLRKLLPTGTSNGGLLRKMTQFDFPSEFGTVSLTTMDKKELPDHLSGFYGYVNQLENTENLISEASVRIAATKLVFGVILPVSIADDSSIFTTLKNLTFSQGGFIFVYDSILTVDGYLVGPMTNPKAVSHPLAEVAIDLQDSPTIPEHLQDMRQVNLETISTNGFKCSSTLPIKITQKLRPAEEIARRLSALALLFAYVAMSEDTISENFIKNFISKEKIDDGLTPSEKNILALPRNQAHEEHVNNIGWRTENIWPLAWIFGFVKQPELKASQLDQEDIVELIGFAPGKNITITEFLSANPVRPPIDIITLEDLFYCAHNAVRSAQLGHPSVPKDFDPVMHGGVVHERRHSLTWALSIGTTWDETDLST